VCYHAEFKSFWVKGCIDINAGEPSKKFEERWNSLSWDMGSMADPKIHTIS